MSGNVTDPAADGGAGDGTDNDLIRSLRAQLKEANAKLKSADPDAIREQVLAEVNRENTAASLMDKAGFPKLGALFAQDTEGELTDEAAAAFLEGLGLTAQTPADGSQPPVVPEGGATPAQIAAEVERLATAGQGAVVSPGSDVALDKLLADATSSDDILKAMRASGLTVGGH